MDVQELSENTNNSPTVSQKQITRKTPPNHNNTEVLHVMYGSRTGNSRAAAELARDYAAYLGMQCQLADLNTLNPEDFSVVKNILLAVSTHGEGDPPTVVENFYHFMHSNQAPSMEKVKFSVLALGDSSYKDFCKTGNDFRKRFLELGATEISPMVECDIDYEENAKSWARKAVEAFENILPARGVEPGKVFSFEINKRESDFENAFYAKVLKKKLLTHPGYPKRTIHLELSMESFNEEFYPGDSFGIYLNNARQLADKLIKVMNFDKSAVVTSGIQKKLLKDALVTNYEITMLTPVVLEKYAKLTNNSKLNNLVADPEKSEKYCKDRDVVDMVQDFPAPVDHNDFLPLLRNLAPRLYSVASSPQALPGQLHLTVGLVEYSVNGRNHMGVSSTFFSDRVEEGDSIPLALEANEKFRLTEDSNKPIIMIATGTGIAPFRAFLQERNHKGAKGENWLFFGDRHQESDFLYKNELLDYQSSGLLTRLNTAFSRDSDKKVYVQDHLFAHRKEIFHWIQNKDAVIYLCGNKRTMGRDVKTCLEKIVATQGKLTPDESKEYLRKMKADKRYQMDLY